MENPVRQIVDELVREAVRKDGFVSAKGIAARAQEQFPDASVSDVVERVISEVCRNRQNASW